MTSQAMDGSHGRDLPDMGISWGKIPGGIINAPSMAISYEISTEIIMKWACPSFHHGISDLTPSNQGALYTMHSPSKTSHGFYRNVDHIL